MRYGAVLAVTGTSGKAARIRELSGGAFIGMEERIIVNFRSAGITDIVVVSGAQKKLVRRLQNQGAVFLQETDPQADMFAFVKRGFLYLKDSCDRIFFCPESAPFFTENTVRLMMDQDADLVISCLKGKKGHPVMLASRFADQILSYEGEGGLNGAINSLGEEPLLLETGDPGTVSEIRTKDEYTALLRYHDSSILRPEITVSLSGNMSFFDRESAALLRQIDRCGNVREACEKNGISYSKGWNMIRNAEEGLGGKIVDRRAGGKDGGGASITARGRQLAELYWQFDEELRNYAEERYRKLFLDSGFFPKDKK